MPKIYTFALLFLLLVSLVHCQEKVTERFIYVPTEEWEAVIKNEPKGVSLSYEKYLELLQKQPKDERKAPVAFVVHDVRYEAKVENKVLRFEMEMLLTALSETQREFVFDFGKMGLEKALLDDKEALITAEEVPPVAVLQNNEMNAAIQQQEMQQRVVQQQRIMVQQQANDYLPARALPQVRYRILLPNRGEHRLKMFFFKTLVTQRDEWKADVVLGEFPGQTFVLATEEDMEYTTEPASQPPKQGKLTLYLGERNYFSLTMRPKEQKDEKQPLFLAHVYSSHLVRVDSIVSIFKIDLEVYYRPQKTFTFQIPANLEILSLSENRWDAKTEGELKIITVQMEEAVEKTHSIQMRCEKQLLGNMDFYLPRLEVLGDTLFRQDGLIYIEKTADIALELRQVQEARQVTTYALFPARKSKGEQTSTSLTQFGEEAFTAFKIASPRYVITLQKKEIVPVLESTFVSAISLYQDGLECAAHITFDVIEGKAKQVSIAIPKDWSLTHVAGLLAKSQSKFSAFSDFSYYIKDSVLYVSLHNKINQGEKLRISLQFQNMPEGWQEDWEEKQMPLPLVAPLETKYLPSFVGVIVDPDYQMDLKRLEHSESVDINIIRSLQVTSENLRLGIKLNDAKSSILVSLKRKVSNVAVTVASYIAVEPERIRCANVLVYDVKNATRNSFTFTLPAAFPYVLNISDEFGTIKEKQSQKIKNSIQWTIKLQKRVLGSYSIYVAYEVPLQTSEYRFDFPNFQFPDVEQRKGFIGVSGISQAEITPIVSKNLTKILNTQLPIISHRDLPATTEYLHSFKYANAPFQLALEIKMHGKVEVATAILQDVTISTLYPTVDLERVICEYTLSHMGLQFFDITLPKDASLWSTVVDDKGEKPNKKGDQISIPVPRENIGKNHVLRVIYERKITPFSYLGYLNLERPTTPANIPVRSFQWNVYMPPSYEVGKFASESVVTMRPWYQTLGRTILAIFDYSYPVYRAEKSMQMAPAPSSTTEQSVMNDAPKQEFTKGESHRWAGKPQPKVPAPMLEAPRPQKKMQQDLLKTKREMAQKDRLGNRSRLEKERRRDSLAEKESREEEKKSKEDFKEEEEAPGAADEEMNAELDEGVKSEEAPSEIAQNEPAPAPPILAPETPAPDKSIASGEINQDWGDHDDGYTNRNKIAPPKPTIIVGKKAPADDTTGVHSAKAKGLRSLDIDVLSTSVRDKRAARGFSLPPSRSIVSLLYFHEDTMRSFRILLATAATLLGLVLFVQRRVNRTTMLLALLLMVSFIPLWLGNWLMPYSNALAWGLLASFAILVSYRILWKIGGWLRLHPQTALMLLGFLTLAGISLEAQPQIPQMPVLQPQQPMLASPTPAPRQIYMSYDASKLGTLDEIKNVFLPYATYVSLWNNAYPDKAIEEPYLRQGKPYYLYHARYEGKVVEKQTEGEGKGAEKQTEFHATFLIEAREAPCAIFLGLGGTAVKKAILYRETQPKEDEKEATPAQGEEVTLAPTDQGYTLLLSEKGRYRVELDFLPQGKVTSLRGDFQFKLAAIATSVLTFVLSEDIEVNLSTFPGDWYEKVADKKKTIVLFPGLHEEVQMQWYQSSESYKAKGLNITADSIHTLTLSDSLLRLESKIQYSVLSGKIDKLHLDIPKGLQIISLSCTNMEKWTLSEDEGKNHILVRLIDSSHQNLALELIADKVIPTIPANVVYPEIVPLDAGRENGQAILVTQNFYNVIVSKNVNLRKISSYEKAFRFYEVFRYNDHPFHLEFSVEKQEFYNFSQSQLVLKVSEEKIEANYQSTLEVKGKEIFSYQIVCPSDWTVTKVLGPAVKSWKAEKKDEKEQIINISFPASLRKNEKTSISLQTEKDLKKGKTFSIPYLASPQVHYHSGDILVAGAQDLTITAQGIQGMQEYDIAAFGEIPEYSKRYAFRFEGGVYAGTIEIQSQLPQIEVDATVNLLVEDDWINFGYFLRYKIYFAAADTFYFRLPASIGSDLDILGANIKETKKEKQGKYYVWKVVLHNKVREPYELALFPKVIENQGTGIVFHPIDFPKEVSFRSYVLIQNHSQYELTPQKMEGMTPMSPGQVGYQPPQTSASDFILAYKADSPAWELTFTENKQEVVHTVKASIDNIKVDSTLDSEGTLRHRIIYNIRHMGLQFLELERLQESQIWGVFVSGIFVRPVKKERQGQEILLIPLHFGKTKSQKEEKLSVRLIYSEKLPPLRELPHSKITLPQIKNIQEVGSIHWSLYAPREYLYRFGGNLSEVGYVSFEEYQGVASSDPNDAAKLVSQNKQVLQSALSRENRLKVRQDNYLKEAEKAQQEILSNVLDVKQQKDENLNEANLRQVQQYSRKNLMDVQRAGRYQSGQKQPEVYRDKKAEKFAGEDNQIFLERQEKNVEKVFQPQEIQTPQEQLAFTFDLSYPGNARVFHFSKRQGDAMLEMRCFHAPHKSVLWRTVQFCGLLLLVALAAFLRLFSRQDGYSFRKFGLTVLFLGISVFFFYFLDFVHYFYL